MTIEQIVSLLSTQGLALVLVLGGALWVVRVLVPRYLDGIKNEVARAAEEAKEGLETQTERIDSQTDAIEVLSTLMLYNQKSQMTDAEFATHLATIKTLRRKVANGGTH